MKNLIKFIAIIIGMFVSQNLFAQKVYSCDSKYDADVKVFVANSKYDADLVVYKVSSKYDATDNKGLWFFVDSKYDADIKVHFVNSKYDADIIIFYTGSKYDTEWRNKSKMHKMQK